MKNIVVIYWSGTGNTEKMAKALVEGASLDGNNVKLLSVDKAKIDHVLNADLVAIGCPAMGDEELEESEMKPFVESISHVVLGKNIVLFGAYGGGNGKWMRNWEEKIIGFGAKLIQAGLIIHRDVIDKELEQCKKLGEIMSRV